MAPNEVNAQFHDWAATLLTGNEPSVLDLAIIFFGLSFSKVRLKAMMVGDDCEAVLIV